MLDLLCKINIVQSEDWKENLYDGFELDESSCKVNERQWRGLDIQGAIKLDKERTKMTTHPWGCTARPLFIIRCVTVGRLELFALLQMR